jgi:hypothetical protein
MTNYDFPPDMKLEQYTAERREYRSRQEQPFMMIEQARFSVTPDDIRQRMVYELRAFLLNREVKEEKETETKTTHTMVCRTWWDFAKATYSNHLSKGSKWTRPLRLWLQSKITHQRDEIKTTITTTNITKTFHMCPHLQTDERDTHLRWLAGEGLLPPKRMF